MNRTESSESSYSLGENFEGSLRDLQNVFEVTFGFYQLDEISDVVLFENE